ncbi:MAG: AEC family transporter [Halarcobacter sp.]
MDYIISALLPIFFIILLGYFLKRVSFPDEKFWQYSDKFTYYILFPSLLIYKLSSASISGVDGFDFVLSGVITLVIVTVLLVVLNKFMFMFESRAFTSIYQGSVRFNTYVFLALIDAVFGDKGLVLAALLMTFMIPLLNIFCVGIFSIYTSSDKISIKSFLISVAKNPLIVACLVGGALNYFGITLFLPIEKTLSLLSSAALPLGLLSVGVGLNIKQLKHAKMELFFSTFVKLAIFPFLIMFVAMAMDIEGLALWVLIIFGAMPTASSAYILARELGGDLQLMSAIITLQTLVSIGTLIVILSILPIS